MLTAVSRIRRSLLRSIRRLRRSEGGWVTSFTLILLIALLGLTGFAVDVANVMTQRTLLQTTADSAAHGAILFRRTMNETQAKERAITLASRNMPTSAFGNVLGTDNVVFGTWNEQTRVFTPQPGATEAVQVTTQRRRENGNAIPVFLLQFAGFDVWNVSAVSIFAGGPNPCSFNGVIANGVADFSSNNIFRPGFCVHGNDHVRLRQNNTFEHTDELESIVSMPDTADLDIPSSGMTGNPGLERALRSGHMDLSSLTGLGARIAAMRAGNTSALPAYVSSNPTSQNVNANAVNNSTFQSGRNYNVTCSGNNKSLTLTSSMNLTNVVITTNCSIMLGNGARIRDSMIATTDTSASSITGTSGSGAQAEVGTACAPGPGTQLFTMGGMRFPAKLIVNGGQFAAQGDITFAAQATLEGAGVSMMSGSDIEWTSNADMSVDYCDQEFGNHLVERRIRMVL
jgi:Flp pilus assembly protein TadG